MIRRTHAAVAHAMVVAAFGVLPAFLTGALVVQLRNDLGIGIEQVGFATAALFISSAAFSRVGGGIVQRMGSSNAMILAPLCSALALAVAAASTGYGMLLVAMILGGLANGIAQPVANLRLSDSVRDERLGLAFGIKQASVPTATFAAGAAIPLLASMTTWRSVFLIAACAALAVACIGVPMRHLVTAKPRSATGGRRRGRLNVSSMVAFAISGFLASVVGTSFGVFFMDAASAMQLPDRQAGFIYSAYSLVGIACRIALGRLSDAYPRVNTYRFISLLLVTGTAGYLLLSTGAQWPFLLGGFLAFAFGWAWPGLLHFAIVRDNADDAAAATGFLQSGSSLGAGIGPLAFGLLIGLGGYEQTWMIASAISLAAALTMWIGARLIPNLDDRAQ